MHMAWLAAWNTCLYWIHLYDKGGGVGEMANSDWGPATARSQVLDLWHPLPSETLYMLTSILCPALLLCKASLLYANMIHKHPGWQLLTTADLGTTNCSRQCREVLLSVYKPAGLVICLSMDDGGCDNWTRDYLPAVEIFKDGDLRSST